MSYYQITVTSKSGKIYQGVKYDYTDDINLMWQKSEMAARNKLKEEFLEIDVVMLSVYSKALKAHMAKYRSTAQARKNQIDY